MMLAVVVLVAATPPPVRFDDAVQRALAQHPALRMAKADLNRALGQLEEARAPSLPTLNVSGIGTRLDADRVLNDRVISGANQISGAVTLTVPIIVPQRWAAWRRAGANAEAAQATADDERRRVAVVAGRAWLSALAQQRVVAAAERGVEVSRAHLDAAAARRSAGIGAELDEVRVGQELSVAKQQLASAKAQLTRLWEQLGVSMGVDGPASAADDEPGLALPTEKMDVTERTDVKAAEARTQANRVAASLDYTDYLPLVTALAQPAYQNPPTLTVPLFSFTAQLVVTLPLYDGGLRYGQQKVRRANLEQSIAQLEQTRRQAASELRAAVAQVQLADDGLNAARDAHKQAQRALQLSQAALQAGGLNALDVIDVDRRSRDAATTVALAEDAARQARLEALAASGVFP